MYTHDNNVRSFDYKDAVEIALNRKPSDISRPPALGKYLIAVRRNELDSVLVYQLVPGNVEIRELRKKARYTRLIKVEAPSIPVTVRD